MKPLFLTLSPGRAGTGKLASLLSLVPSMYAEHDTDGKDSFCWIRQENITNPDVGHRFVEERLKWWDSLPYQYVANTGHITGEGFFEHFLSLGVVPNIITLRRNPREVARSMWKLDWIPGRNRLIAPWYCGPDEPEVLPLTNWKKMTRYQLCYWWVCDTERRIQLYTPILKQHGAKIWETTLPQILDLTHFNNMLDYFNLPNISQLPQNKVNDFNSIYLGEVPEDKGTPSDKITTMLEQEVLANIPSEFKLHLEETWKHLK